MGALLDELGRSNGELIRAGDWNGLITAVEALELSLNERITSEVATINTRIDTETAAIGTRIDSVDEAVGELREEVDDLTLRVTKSEADIVEARDLVEELRKRFRGVTLQTGRLHFAIGELAEITSQITDLDGSAVSFGSGEPRPWVDFVSAWGQLKPVPGFTSIGGAGDRTISVQVNAQGVARVLLRAEHADGFTDEAESEVAAVLTTIIPARSQSIGQAILASNTPLEARERGAFTLLSTEYERSDAHSVQQYVDAYYLKNPSIIGGGFGPSLIHRWRDYRSTVMAFAKTDGDPQTADPSLGACSIQVTFRDWITPWIHLDFFDKPTLVTDYTNLIGGLITIDFDVTAGAVKNRIRDLVAGKGLIGKQRTYGALAEAMDRVQVTTPPPFLEDFKETMKNGILVQQGLEYGQSVGIGGAHEGVAIDAFAGTGQMAGHMTKMVEQAVNTQVDQKIAAAETKIDNTVSKAQADFMDDFYAASGAFSIIQNEVSALKGDVASVSTAVNQKADHVLVTRFLENVGR